MALTLEVTRLDLAVGKLPRGATLPTRLWSSPFVSITLTREEVSVVAPTSAMPSEAQVEVGWSCLRVAGTLDFALTGVLASILKPLAEAKVSVFSISTFDTDYVLVKQAKLVDAIAALKAAGFKVKD